MSFCIFVRSENSFKVNLLYPKLTLYVHICQYGEGPMCNTCHILVPQKWYSKLNEIFDCEEQQLEDIGDDLFVPGSSRLGCQVHLNISMHMKYRLDVFYIIK